MFFNPYNYIKITPANYTEAHELSVSKEARRLLEFHEAPTRGELGPVARSFNADFQFGALPLSISASLTVEDRRPRKSAVSSATAVNFEEIDCSD